MKRFLWQLDEVIYIYALYECGLIERVYRYVGRTRNIKARLKGHKKEHRDYPVVRWIQEVQARSSTIDLEVLQELVNPTRTEASIAERNWVMALGALATNAAMRRMPRIYKNPRTKLSPHPAEETTADAAKQNK